MIDHEEQTDLVDDVLEWETSCPECGAGVESLVNQGGCITCLACGWSVCA